MYYSFLSYGGLFVVNTPTSSNQWLLLSIGGTIFLVASILSFNLNGAINHSRLILCEIQASIPLIYKISNPETKQEKAGIYIKELKEEIDRGEERLKAFDDYIKYINEMREML